MGRKKPTEPDSFSVSIAHVCLLMPQTINLYVEKPARTTH